MTTELPMGETVEAVSPIKESNCPFCRGALAPEATKCSHCGSNVGDIQTCLKCAEPVRASAVICPFCRADLTPATPQILDFLTEPWIIHASPIGAFITEQLPTALFFPPTLTITSEEIHIRRKMFLGLRTMDQKLSVQRIASVRAVDGVFWGALVVETYGGSSADLSINGLDKEEARETATLIERIIHHHAGQSSAVH